MLYITAEFGEVDRIQGMKKRQLLLIAAPLTVCIVVFGTLSLRPSSPRVSWTNYVRIQEGMTFDDVERILGHANSVGAGVGGVKNVNAVWVSKDASVMIIVFQEDRVFMTQWIDSKNVTIFDVFRRLVHLD